MKVSYVQLIGAASNLWQKCFHTNLSLILRTNGQTKQANLREAGILVKAGDEVTSIEVIKQVVH